MISVLQAKELKLKQEAEEAPMEPLKLTLHTSISSPLKRGLVSLLI